MIDKSAKSTSCHPDDFHNLIVAYFLLFRTFSPCDGLSLGYANGVLLSSDELAVSRGRELVISNLSFSLAEGEGIGLVGANGAGKTTLIHTLLGLLAPSSGSFSILNKPALDPQTRARLGVVWQESALPLAVSDKRWISFIARSYGKPVNSDLLRSLKYIVTGKPLRHLSGGQKQKLAIFSALNHAPDLLILDEPSVGLDFESRSAFLELLRQHHQRGGATLISSHIASDISSVCNSLIDLSDGNSRESYSALFTTNRAINFASLELNPGTSVTETPQGYRISTDREDILGITKQLCDQQNISIESFTVISHA